MGCEVARAVFTIAVFPLINAATFKKKKMQRLFKCGILCYFGFSCGVYPREAFIEGNTVSIIFANGGALLVTIVSM